MELSGDEKGRKCRLGVLYGTLGRQKWAKIPLQEPAIRKKLRSITGQTVRWPVGRARRWPLYHFVVLPDGLKALSFRVCFRFPWPAFLTGAECWRTVWISAGFEYCSCQKRRRSSSPCQQTDLCP